MPLINGNIYTRELFASLCFEVLDGFVYYGCLSCENLIFFVGESSWRKHKLLIQYVICFSNYFSSEYIMIQNSFGNLRVVVKI